MPSRSLTAVLVGVTVMLALGTTAFGQGLVAFDPPNSASAANSCATGINDGGQVTGYFTDAVLSTIRGFVRERNGNITVFDAGANDTTIAESLNNAGAITGTFSNHSFVRDPDGNVTLFDVPNSGRTVSYQINAGGDIAGRTLLGDKWHGFVRDRSGILTVFDAPNASETDTNGINDDGYVTGFFNDAFNASHVFVRDPSGGFSVVDPPNSSSAEGVSINKAGQITGDYQDRSVNNQFLGFVRDSSGGFTVFNPPNSDFLVVGQINAAGEITGSFVDHDTRGLSGFVRHSNGDISVFGVPTARATSPRSINADGELAGCFTDTNGLTHEFVRGKRAQIVIANVLSRDASGNIVVQLNLADTGELAADNVVITSIQVSGLDAAGLPPAIDTIAAGTSVLTSATIGDTVGDPGTPTTLTVSGTYGSGTFTSSSRVILP